MKYFCKYNVLRSLKIANWMENIRVLKCVWMFGKNDFLFIFLRTFAVYNTFKWFLWLEFRSDYILNFAYETVWLFFLDHFLMATLHKFYIYFFWISVTRDLVSFLLGNFVAFRFSILDFWRVFIFDKMSKLVKFYINFPKHFPISKLFLFSLNHSNKTLKCDSHNAFST